MSTPAKHRNWWPLTILWWIFVAIAVIGTGAWRSLSALSDVGVFIGIGVLLTINAVHQRHGKVG
jgi:hypothetical protein